MFLTLRVLLTSRFVPTSAGFGPPSRSLMADKHFLLLSLLLCPAAALLAPPRLLPRGQLVTRRPIDWARHGLVQASGEPSSSPKPKWRPVLLGAGGGATLVAARRFGGAGAVAALLQLACVALPLFSAARHLRNGRKREALLVVLLAAYRRFCSRWWQYLTIPLFAGGVGWLTNKIAVDMIFYPVEFVGLNLRTWPNQPLGWFGWQASSLILRSTALPPDPAPRQFARPSTCPLTRPPTRPPALPSHPPTRPPPATARASCRAKRA